MANEPSKTPTQAKPQSIPLSKIHELPGVFNPKPQDRTLGSMVLSIQNSGVKEPVILRQRDDGEYQLLSGYRRRRASELAKLQEIPAHVYEMTMNEAINYRKGAFFHANFERRNALPEDRVCQGYRVIDSIRVDNVEVVLAHNPKAVEKYVTWMCYNLEKPLEFDTGCYFTDEASARKNMRKRANGLRELLPPLHPDKRPHPDKQPPVRKKPHGKAR